jgi:putative transposase
MRKRHTSAFKAQIVAQALKEEKTLTQIASENDIHPNQISAWKATAISGLPTLFERESKAANDQAVHQQQLEELYAQIGRLSTQVNWLKKKSGLELP